MSEKYIMSPGERALKRTCRKALERLGIPVREELIGWRGSDRYGYSPIHALIVTGEEYMRFLAEREKTKEKRAKAKLRREEKAQQAQIEREELARSMGLLPDSRTFASYLRGEIEEEEAIRIGRHTSQRHEETNYEELLARGYSRDDARAFAEKTER